MSNPIPERLNNFTLSNDANKMIGIVDLELPSLEAMTDTVSGAGIAGEIDSPTVGHFGSMTTTINFRTITGDVMSLAEQKAHNLTARGSMQIYDAGTGEYKFSNVRVVMKAIPKNLGLGTFAPASATDTSHEFEVNYLKIEIDKKEVVEIDKLNFKAVINGKDFLSAVRQFLG